MPLFAVGPAAFILARVLAGMFAAVYDPAARGYLVDANPRRSRARPSALRRGPDRRLHGRPAVGGLAAAAAGDPTVVFWVCGVALVVSAVLVVRLPSGHAWAATSPRRWSPASPGPATRRQSILNRLFLVAVVLNVVAFLAGGTYEVVWSLYLTSLGASIGLIGVTFFTFACR